MPIFYSFETNDLPPFFFLCRWFAMQPVSGGAIHLAGASTTLPRTSPNQANLTASQHYATLPLQASIPRTRASPSHTVAKAENAPTATSESPVPAHASAPDATSTHPAQPSASAVHPMQSALINQGSYSTTVPATVHYTVEVPNYSIPPLPPTLPPPPPLVRFPPFIDRSRAGNVPPPTSVLNYSTFPAHSDAENKNNFLHSPHAAYSAVASLPDPLPSPALSSSTEQAVDTQDRQYSTSTVASAAGASLPQSHALCSQYSNIPPSASISSIEGKVSAPSHSVYSQYSGGLPPAAPASTEGAALSPSHTLHDRHCALPHSGVTSSAKGAVLPRSHTLYSQYSALPRSTSSLLNEEAIPPSHTSTLPPPASTPDESDAYSSTDDLLDPIARSRKPNARLSGKKIDPMEVGL
jgi:hypothetical protein